MLTIAQLTEACGARLQRPQENAHPTGFSIDSRSLHPGQFFIALPGCRTDGHRFLGEAFAHGACGALVQAGWKLPDNVGHNLISVPDTGRALRQAAGAYRSQLAIPLIGISGSAGKTTSKELLAHLLRRAGRRVYRSPGNYNSEIGLPLALLNLPLQTEIGVFELALQRPGEIGQLAQILRPTVGLITGIGDAHLGFFPDRQALAAAKWELIQSLPPDGLALLNLDDEFLSAWAGDAPCRVLGYGITNAAAAWRASGIEDSSLEGLRFRLETPQGNWSLKSKLLGRHNVYNIVAAAALVAELGVDLAACEGALAEFEPVEHRLQLRRSERYGWLLDDSYNASPQATKQALRMLARLHLPGYQKIFVFGGILELGAHSREAHREIAAKLARLAQDDDPEGANYKFFGLGERAAQTGRALLIEQGWSAERVRLAGELEGLARLIQAELAGDKNLILIKGSRALGLEQLVEILQSS